MKRRIVHILVLMASIHLPAAGFASDMQLRPALVSHGITDATLLTLRPGHLNNDNGEVAGSGPDPIATGSIASGAMQIRGATDQVLTSTWMWADDPTLRGPISSALGRSDGLRAGNSEVAIARARSLRSIAAFLPVVSGNVTTQLYRNGQSGTSIDNVTTAGINITMPLFAGGQNWNMMHSAKANERAVRFDARSTAESVILDVLSAKIEYGFAEKQVAIAAGNIAIFNQLRNSVTKRMAAGFSSAADLADIEANLATAERQAEAARAALQAARESLRLSTGMEAGTGEVRLGDLERRFSLGKAGLVSSAKMRNNAINAARERAEAAEYLKRAAYGKYLPRIDLNGDYTRVIDQNGAGNFDPNRYSVQVKLRVLLVDFNTMADVKEARAQAISADYRARDAAGQIEKQIAIDWESYVSKSRQAALATKQSEAAKRSLVSRRKQFEAGLIDVDSVASQAQNVAGAKLAEAQIIAEKQVLMIRIAAAAGLIGTKHGE